MSWNQGGGGGSPWGGGGGQGPWGRGGPGGPQAPNLDELLRKGLDRFQRIIPGGAGSSRGLALIGLIALAIWLATGLYRVLPDEQGVVLTFGRWDGQ
ncbi:MAG: protease modulator HflK N-terminal domain-containing protein, partial [Alphaproteobacteria bacterium]